MRSVHSFMLLSILCISVSFFSVHNAFSQADQKTNVPAAGSDSDAYVTGITSGRARSLVGVAVGLLSLIIGWRVKRRSSLKANALRSWAVTALVLGVGALVLSVAQLISTNGGFGTGGGKAGAIVALILALIGMSLSGTSLRSKKHDPRF